MGQLGNLKAPSQDIQTNYERKKIDFPVEEPGSHHFKQVIKKHVIRSTVKM